MFNASQICMVFACESKRNKLFSQRYIYRGLVKTICGEEILTLIATFNLKMRPAKVQLCLDSYVFISMIFDHTRIDHRSKLKLPSSF